MQLAAKRTLDKHDHCTPLPFIHRSISPLNPVQLATLSTGALHQLLVLLLLHLQLPLPLDADGKHLVGSSTHLFPTQLAQSHALQEGAGCAVLLDQRRAMGHYSDLAVGLGSLLQSEDSLVDAGLWLGVHRLLGSGFGRRGGLRLGQRWRTEWEELSGHGVELDVKAAFGAFRMSDLNLGHVIVGLLYSDGILLGADGHALHRLLEVVHGSRERRHDVVELAALGSGCEDLGEGLVAYGPGEALSD